MANLIDALNLEGAKNAIQAYNKGSYRNETNLDLDQEGYRLFKNGVGQSIEKIEEQVYFAGKKYGGVAGFQKAIEVSDKISQCIYDDRAFFTDHAFMAPKLIDSPSSLEVVRRLYKAFVHEIEGKSGWLVWSSKYLHFLNPHAFSIQDSRVLKCFGLSSYVNSAFKYHELIKAIRQFLIEYEDWLLVLREADKEHYMSDLKLIDKIFYTIGEGKTKNRSCKRMH